MTNNLDAALSEVYNSCTQETYDTIVDLIRELEREVESLIMELAAVNYHPRHSKPKWDDWD